MRYCVVRKDRERPTIPASPQAMSRRTVSGVQPIARMRPTLKLSPSDLDAALRGYVDEDEDEAPSTVRQPRIADAWAKCMNDYPEQTS
jgi:hypothetical protein